MGQIQNFMDRLGTTLDMLGTSWDRLGTPWDRLGTPWVKMEPLWNLYSKLKTVIYDSKQKNEKITSFLCVTL